MLDHFVHFLDLAGGHGAAVLALVFIAAAVEAAFGLGALVPAETAIVLAAVVLARSPLLIAAVTAAAAGAFVGDHLGFAVGRRLGSGIADTRAVRRIGPDRWLAATDFVERRGTVVMVVARLLPGVRTVVAAAAGASRMRYSRFALAAGIAAIAWSSLWVLGGAALGSAFLAFADRAALPAAVGAAAATAGFLLIRRMRIRT